MEAFLKLQMALSKNLARERVRNTPLCESAIIGVGLGFEFERTTKSMVEMQFADFVTCGFNQIINNLAKLHYRWGQNADVVVQDAMWRWSRSRAISIRRVTKPGLHIRQD